MLVSLKILDWFGRYGCQMKASYLLFYILTFCQALVLSYWEISKRRGTVLSVFITKAIDSVHRSAVALVSLTIDFSVIIRLSFTKCRQFKDQIASFHLTPITSKSVQYLQRLSHAKFSGASYLWSVLYAEFFGPLYLSTYSTIYR